MTAEIQLFAVVGLLAFANGSNDNPKGVATLYGSGTTGLRQAIGWATITTLAGSLAGWILADRLLIAFRGGGLVPAPLTHDPRFLLAAGFGASGAVLLASRVGLPVSTTHALLGGLLGAGVVAAKGAVRLDALGREFALPLLASPLLALATAWILYSFLRAARLRLGVERRMCLCVGAAVEPLMRTADGALVIESRGIPLTLQQEAFCRERYVGSLIGFDAQALLDRLHFLSAGLVGIARGMNDAPKIAALLVASRLTGVGTGLGMVALAMAVGGLLGARRVVETLGRRITPLNHGQGFTANAVTAGWVLLASFHGLPVSTTHVAVGSLAGIGAMTGKADWGTLAVIATAWVTTLPLAAVLGALAYAVVS